MTDQTNKLEPCPFCGGKAYIDQHGTRRQSCVISCHTCGCMLETNEEGANCGDQWNRRASAPAAGSGPKDHEVAATVNKLRDIAVEFHDSQQLRERIADVVRALLAQYGAPQDKEDAERWKPIETAPLTEEIWAYNGEQGRMIWSEGTDWALWVWSDELMADVDPSPDQPTHWMPLPPAPQEGE